MATMTAQQRREQARREYNADLAGCPGHHVLSLLSEKWATLVISTLADGPKRHSDLAREVAGATQKMLTQTLRRLEREGVVRRTATPTLPARVDYELTDLGTTLLPVQRAILAWGEEHIDEMVAARERFDAGAA